MSLLRNTIHKANIGFNTLFNKVFAETETNYEKVATIVPSTGATESYQWLGTLPKLRQWVGDRIIRNISNYEYTIKNKPFEATMSIDKYDMEDDKLGIYKPQVESLAEAAKQFPDELVFKILEDGFENKCYDGVAFFGTHKVGKLNFKNMFEKALSIESYSEARASMMKIKDDEGRSLKIMPKLLVVPPALESKAREILKSDFINGTTNIYKDTAELLVVPDLTSDTAWYLLDTSKAIKPIIFQKRQDPQLVSLVDEKDRNVFMNRQYLYGVDMRCNAGYGFWQMAFGSKGTA